MSSPQLNLSLSLTHPHLIILIRLFSRFFVICQSSLVFKQSSIPWWILHLFTSRLIPAFWLYVNWVLVHSAFKKNNHMLISRCILDPLKPKHDKTTHTSPTSLIYSILPLSAHLQIDLKLLGNGQNVAGLMLLASHHLTTCGLLENSWTSSCRRVIFKLMGSNI